MKGRRLLARVEVLRDVRKGHSADERTNPIGQPAFDSGCIGQVECRVLAEGGAVGRAGVGGAVLHLPVGVYLDALAGPAD